MFVELVELLRCPADHAESQLVAAAARTDDRHIVDGVLGCPVCGAEYPIAAGVARIGEPPPAPAPAPVPAPVPAPGDGLALRIAAFLDLTDARGFALLVGAWCGHVDAIQRITETPLVALNPPGPVTGLPAGVVLSSVAPFAAGALRAAALDADAPPALHAGVVRAVRAGGRIMAPVDAPVPAGVRELDRDAAHWVGERVASPRLVSLERPAPAADPRKRT